MVLSETVQRKRELLLRYFDDILIEIYYWKDQQQREVDFVVKTGLKVTQLIQVCWNMREEKTREREIKSLAKAGNELHCDDLLVITADEEESQTVRRNGAETTICLLPLWRWLLTEVPLEVWRRKIV